MNIRQALAVSDFGVSGRASSPVHRDRILSAMQVADRVYAQGRKADNQPRTAKAWSDSWLKSERFLLLDLPLHFAASPAGVTDASKVQGCMRAAADSEEPIVVDLNKRMLGQSSTGYFPPVIVVDGKHRLEARRLQGRETIKAWVGELAAEALKLHAHTDRRGKPREDTGNYIALQAQAEQIKARVARVQTSSIEQAMRIFGAAGGAGMGGPGGVSTSLSQGSGPSLAMKPRPTTGGATAMPSMKSKGRRRMKARRMRGQSGGYEGYKDASDTMRQKTKGGSKSDMSKQLKGSGYFGYGDATDKMRQKTKGGSKSEMTSQLKGAAAKVARIVTKYKQALAAGYQHSADELQAKAPPGMEHTVMGLKKHFGEGSSAPFKIAWWLKNKKKKGKKMAADVDIHHKSVDLGERPRKVAPPKV